MDVPYPCASKLIIQVLWTPYRMTCHHISRISLTSNGSHDHSHSGDKVPRAISLGAVGRSSVQWVIKIEFLDHFSLSKNLVKVARSGSDEWGMYCHKGHSPMSIARYVTLCKRLIHNPVISCYIATRRSTVYHFSHLHMNLFIERDGVSSFCGKLGRLWFTSRDWPQRAIISMGCPSAGICEYCHHLQSFFFG